MRISFPSILPCRKQGCWCAFSLKNGGIFVHNFFSFHLFFSLRKDMLSLLFHLSNHIQSLYLKYDFILNLPSSKLIKKWTIFSASAEGVQPIAWATRMHIAIDVARGLSFLHCLNANVIYRDLKASNILLDSVCWNLINFCFVGQTLV